MNLSYKSLLSLLFALFIFTACAQDQNRDIYELRIYHLKNQQQEARIDSFLKVAYIPALRKEGVGKVGVFKPLEGDSLFGKRIYVLIPYQSTDQLLKMPDALEKDKNYLSLGNAYINAAHNDSPYERIETVILQAFEGMPQFRETDLTNAPEERIYELRSYEGATEKLYRKKVEMFDKGEIDIFKKLEFNPVFFGEVIAGSNMPNLMYMTAFKDMASRDAHWKSFTVDPDWERMKSMKEYANTVSHIDIYFLRPTSYSEL